jgi:hypothetical protein
LLPLIRQSIGDEVFSVASLMQAVVDAGDEPLASVLDSCGSTRAIGKLFARCTEQAIDGWRIERISPPNQQPVVWHVSNVSQT